MPISDDENKIVAAFQRYIKNGSRTEIERYSLEELRHVDQQLMSSEHQPFRNALKNRIRELEQQKTVTAIAKPHWTITPGFLIALVAVIFAAIAAWPVIQRWIQPSSPEHTNSSSPPPLPHSEERPGQ